MLLNKSEINVHCEYECQVPKEISIRILAYYEAN